MNHLLNISRSGINSLQQKLDVTAQNIANVNTAGYKSQSLQFRELLHNPITSNQAPINEAVTTASISRGVQGLAKQDLLQQGTFSETGNQWDLAIEGAAFFGVRDENNQLLLTRAGAFSQDETGRIVNAQGQAVDMNLIVPTDQWPKGTVNVTSTGTIGIVHDNQQTIVGQMQLYQPTNLNELSATGNNTFQLAPGAQVIASNQGNTIRQGSIEQSTVDVAQSMTELLVTQRAYSLNNRVLQSTDEMLSTINRFTD